MTKNNLKKFVWLFYKAKHLNAKHTLCPVCRYWMNKIFKEIDSY